MKTFLLFLVLSCTSTFQNYSYGQTTRFFRFQICPESTYGNWQDTSFIAWTSDPAVINDALAELALPIASRSKFPTGALLAGDGGYNCNASFCFSWHLDPTNWSLAENAIEVCDGCPYQDVESDTSYWINNVGSFCPWGGTVAEEITGPVGISDHFLMESIQLFPVPATNELNIKIPPLYESVNVTIIDIMGCVRKRQTFISGDKISLDLSHFSMGTYFIKLNVDDFLFTLKFSKL